MGENHMLKYLSNVLCCTDAQYAANDWLIDQFLGQFSFEAAHSGYESIDFDD